MRFNGIRKYCNGSHTEVFPYSTIKIFRKNEENITQNAKNEEKTDLVDRSSEYRENDIKIQMLSHNLYKQIFGSDIPTTKTKESLSKYINELKTHDIKVSESSILDDVVLKLPPLQGNNIEEHFLKISKEQVDPYKNLIASLLKDLPPMPQKWAFKSGWTCYKGSTMVSVDYPDEEALVFDVEVCMKVGQGPTLACAVGKHYWYSWSNEELIQSIPAYKNNIENRKYYTNKLIPMEGKDKKEKIVIGHNVSYDRAKIREQYFLDDTNTKFLDTMSLHVCVSGITSYQRAMLKSKNALEEEDAMWSTQSSLNSLADVLKLYCDDELSKDSREIFIKGTLEDVRNDFQNLLTYCANDVNATHKVVRKLYPMFLERFPHPATLAGMLELGSAYLPVNTNWNRYIEEVNLTYEEFDIESKQLLSHRANDACYLIHDNKYKSDLWMWDQDWSVQPLKLKSINSSKKSSNTKNISKNSEIEINQTDESERLRKKFDYLYETKNRLPARRPFLLGYPAWYRKLCKKPNTENWWPGPQDIGTGMHIVPKLLQLCWEGYPLHYIRDHGWGFLVPFQNTHEDGREGIIPIEELVKKCPVLETQIEASENESNEAFSNLWKDVEGSLSKKDFYNKGRKDRTSGKYTGTGIWCNTVLEGVCWFLKLPHKDGNSYRVGNPLAKDFLSKFSENVLSGDGVVAERVIDIARKLSYWRNNRERIASQMVVWLSQSELPKELDDFDGEYGAIIPQVVVCGTLTRRAMEPTWMTASNALRERVGSELRAMIQAPQGYKIVGADVDSQELWIASVLGDAHATGIHGATPLGWMTLSGSKSSGTDMHSITAKAVGISRDHAKVINYARIYGAGQNFAQRLIKQFNPTISDNEARSKAIKMFALTKGKKLYYLLPEYQADYKKHSFSAYEAIKIAAANGKPVREMFEKGRWIGGTESAMFNRLEEIAESEKPTTPFLNAHLSRALQPTSNNDDRFLPTRINWVVQSGAVDFLHLMLVSMRWLMSSNIRFCLSFHDEVRYLVKNEYAYKAALALHVTNLLTRSFCASRVGLKDLPQSVAFFASVEVDTVLRKEANMDCKTPSNPHGLEAGYSIPKGESLNIYDAIQKAGTNDLSSWQWHNKNNNK